ncbi:MAG: hypothetical protein QW334_01590 [Thermofilum sp.]
MEWGYGRGTLLCLTIGAILMIIGGYLFFTFYGQHVLFLFGAGMFVVGAIFIGVGFGILIAWLVFSRELPELFKR